MKATLNTPCMCSCQACIEESKYHKHLRKGVDILQETEVTNSPQFFQWQGYGMKLRISPQSLPSNVDSCTITITVSLSGQYKFPADTELVSPVFWFKCDPPCKFNKLLTLEIQHCVSLNLVNSSCLFMTRTQCTQKDFKLSQ